MSLVMDPSLAHVNVWHSVHKYYCHGQNIVERLIDEPWTADTWSIIDDELPVLPEPYPHCFVPLHLWIDKGRVSRRVNKYPMVLRAAWLPRNIRNASGNGGGVLLGYLPIVEDPHDPSDRKAKEKVVFQQFRRNIYQQVLRTVFKSLKRRSWEGEVVKCGDSRTRTLFPGVLIESVDGEEAANFCACRAALANYPCPKCLVHKSQLHNITGSYEQRTSASMSAVLHEARQASNATAKDNILKDFGLHDIKHFLWRFRFSDPYSAISYDTLHSDDLGKWGDHLWELLLQVLEEGGVKGRLTIVMAEFPRWPNLRHFPNVTTMHFGEGNCFLDILKCIVYCIVHLLPAKAPLIHCIRAYVKFRLMVGLRCMSESRLKALERFIHDYEKTCKKVAELHGKNFDFLKQHGPNHAPSDIRAKGTTDNYSTRPGEGFQQEASEAYEQTNRKGAEHQMVRIDENQEAMAHIRMAVNDDASARSRKAHADEQDDDDFEDHGAMIDQRSESQHWALGAPDGSWTNSRLWEELAADKEVFRSFDTRLRNFISSALPDELLACEDPIQIRAFKCAYLSYQSQEDWTAARDIVRCNENFHRNRRFDCVLINFDSPDLTFGRLRALFRCRLVCGKHIDLAVIRMFTRSAWKPKTVWDGCRVYEELHEPTFVLMDYIVRGALLTPVFDQPKKSLHYLVDTVDADIFLRANKL
ncbi:hypothetical protein NEOLEDRAFT_1086238 [Neolentinus lepideus HHB14362 ss-1]|uniref:Uncharacterized protein n=1 Tax=Neolentinus lepideus HHB14362 ss-1 TaxID=1314782 RepID=A0A165V652_9AGAM|nr:hypothetical protein NEOLEDRAFT_1086238 [Neolentinus lepideus HHB14362 ss-1]